MLVKGNVEQFNRRTVSGWLTLERDPDSKLMLELVLDEHAIQVAAADRYRPDLEQAGWAGGNCAFEFYMEPPLTEAEVDRVKLRIAGSALYLELPRDQAVALRAPDEVEPDLPGLKVFVVGSPRSGTSVLLRAIQSEFGLPARGESHVIPAVARALHELRVYYERFRDSADDLLIHRLPITEFERTLFRQIRAFYADMFGDKGWVDKTPSDEAVHSAGLIRRIFPDAKVIMTKRNGIEVVDSFRRKFNSSIEDASRSWVSVMQGIEQVTARDPDILVVDQFDFTNNSAKIGLQIAGHLGKPKLGRKVALFLKNNCEDKLSSHSWTRSITLNDTDWTDDEKRYFVSICEEKMQIFDYIIQ